MLFGGVYKVYGIRSLFQGHSPGGATILMCLICTSSVGSQVGVSDEVVVWVDWVVRGGERGIRRDERAVHG